MKPKSLPILTLIFLLILPTVAQASLASDMAAFKENHHEIYQRIEAPMAAKMDQLVQDVYNDSIANYSSQSSTFDQVNKQAARRLLHDPNYESLLGYIARQITDPANEDVSGQYERLLDEICTIIAGAVDKAQNNKPGPSGGGGGGDGGSSGTKIPIVSPEKPEKEVKSEETAPIETPPAITVTPQQLEEIQTHWANSQLQRLITLGIVKGDEKGLINPDAPITRAEFAAMLVRGLGLNNAPVAQGSFYDVPADSWCFDIVNTIAAAGIVEGYEGHRFAPNDPITREQMAVMIIRALRQQGVLPPTAAAAADNSGTAPFADSQAISTWATSAVLQALELGLLEGRSHDIFAPQAQATRAEAGVIILRPLDRLFHREKPESGQEVEDTPDLNGTTVASP